MPEKNIIFIITSVIYFKNVPLSYSAVRSDFSPEQRAEQTRKTIQSIRIKIPDAKIYLIEAGNNQSELPDDLIGSVDRFIYLGNKFLVKLAVNSRFKGLGEAVLLIYAKKQLKVQTGFYFKISGRYYLNSDFNVGNWNFDKFNFKFYPTNLSTRLYGFSTKYFDNWQKALRKSLYQLWQGKSIEDTLTENIDPDLINKIDTLGVEGQIAPTQDLIIE